MIDQSYINRIKRHYNEMLKIKLGNDSDLSWDSIDPYDQDAFLAFELVLKMWEIKQKNK